jgi:hypothetical protein
MLLFLAADSPSLHSQLLRLVSREISTQRMYREGYAAAQRTASLLLDAPRKSIRPAY